MDLLSVMQFCFAAVRLYTSPGVRRIFPVFSGFFRKRPESFPQRKARLWKISFVFPGEGGLSGLSKRQAPPAPPVPSLLFILIFF
ncbi:hypothetical protein INF35_08760 [Subdoligranulum sp. DSM 109015]|uniref:Uncharacterized protein n=1 Tax=Gemmiger gallinarum TaxID=2779354 RepID=A0ABR9R431_9FIRM|nr:hypothetical protein [Gemmiger gallinarum]